MLLLATTATVRRIRRSLDDDSVTTLVRACVTSRVDYCGSLLIGSLKKTTKKLQHVLNSTARIVSNMRKFDRGLAHFRRSELHWLDVVDRVQFRVFIQVFRCLHKISVHFLQTCLQRSCSPPSAISWLWSPGLPSCRTILIHFQTPP